MSPSMSETVTELKKRRRAAHERWRLLQTELKAPETDLKAIDRVLAMVDPAFSASRDGIARTRRHRDTVCSTMANSRRLL